MPAATGASLEDWQRLVEAWERGRLLGEIGRR